MREIKLDELKQIQINILKDVDLFCRKNNINYWVDCGTLLGAIRHKGYIPWDDDIDIGMLRDDYEKFSKLYNASSNGNLKFISVETDTEYYYCFGKVIDQSTVLYEPNKEKGDKIAVYIDVFVYDNAPDDDNKVNKMFFKRDIYNKLNNARTNHHRKTNSIFKEIAAKIGEVILVVFPKQYFTKKMISNSKKYTDKNTSRVGNFTSMTRMTGSKDIFKSFVDVEFEGLIVKAPIGYDRWLRSFYGDYMQLPPEEKRVSHHEFEAFYIE